MQYGFIKTAAISPVIKVAYPEYNSNSIFSEMQKAEKDGVRLAVMPELCLSGYTCGDLFNQELLIEKCKEALITLVKKSKGMKIIAVVGFPFSHNNLLYNCAAVIYDGNILGIIPKTNIPTFNDEKRYFVSANDQITNVIIDEYSCPFGRDIIFSCNNMIDFSFAIEICEDAVSPLSPCVFHASAGANIIINISASPEVAGKAEYRRNLISSLSKKLVCGYVISEAAEGESTTDMVFAGHNLIAEDGIILGESKPFREKYTVSEIDVQYISSKRKKLQIYSNKSNNHQIIYFDFPIIQTKLTRFIDKSPFIPSDTSKIQERCESIFEIQSHGLKKRLLHTNAKSMVIGISGGLDSSLALLVCTRAADLISMPRSQIIALTMPCFGTTKRTKANAIALCSELSVSLREIDITNSVLSHFNDIGQDPTIHDITFENAQARERTQILMDIANMENGLVIGTGSLSELALGWATYNADHMSMYSVNSSVPKTLIRHMIQYSSNIAKTERLKNVLLDILNTPVSPELLPLDNNGEISQKTEDIVGPYELHDFFLHCFIELGFSPEKIFYLAKSSFNEIYSDTIIYKWLSIFISRFFSQQFKRSCLPDGPKVGSVSLSPRTDLRMPSDACSFIWQENISPKV